jgi:hypothetical protein
LDVDNAKVVILELLMPSCSPASQFLWQLPVREIFVVHFYHKGFLGPDEVESPVVYCFDYSEELEVVGIVVLFGGGEGCQVEGYWVVLLCGGWLCPFILREDGLNSVFQHVSLEIEHFVEVRLSQNQFADHFVLKFFEGLLLVVFPVPRCGLFGEVQEGVCYL